MNKGHDITMEMMNEPTNPHFIVTGGPLSYAYRASQIKIHFGTDNEKGSEHLIAGKQFPLEVDK